MAKSKLDEILRKMFWNGFDRIIFVTSTPISYRIYQVRGHIFNFEKSSKFTLDVYKDFYGILRCFFMLSEFTPFHGVNSDGLVSLISLDMQVHLVQKFAILFF